VCDKAIPPAPGALATVDCRESAQSGGPAAARYSIFPNKNALSRQFESSIQENDELQRCPGADAESPITWHYQASPDMVAGSVACGTYQGNADIVWTQDDDLLLADQPRAGILPSSIRYELCLPLRPTRASWPRSLAWDEHGRAAVVEAQAGAGDGGPSPRLRSIRLKITRVRCKLPLRTPLRAQT
jgi:hypothetical protein